MKKMMIEVFGADVWGREWHDIYECESFEEIQKDNKDFIRLEDVNTYKTTKTGKIERKQKNKGVYLIAEKLPHCTGWNMYVWENGTDNLIKKW